MITLVRQTSPPVWSSLSQNSFCPACTGKARDLIQVHPKAPWSSYSRHPWDWCHYSHRDSRSTNILREIPNEWPSTSLGVSVALHRRKMRADTFLLKDVYTRGTVSCHEVVDICVDWLCQTAIPTHCLPFWTGENVLGADWQNQHSVFISHRKLLLPAA